MALNYLLITYGEEQIRRWVNRLTIFRLCTAYPNPNNIKPEHFLAKVKYSSEEELNDILDRLMLEPEPSPEAESEDALNFAESTIATRVLMNNVPCIVTVQRNPNFLTIEVSGTVESPFKLDETVFLRAVQLDSFLTSLALDVVDPPQDDAYCISPKYFPEAFD